MPKSTEGGKIQVTTISDLRPETFYYDDFNELVSDYPYDYPAPHRRAMNSPEQWAAEQLNRHWIRMTTGEVIKLPPLDSGEQWALTKHWDQPPRAEGGIRMSVAFGQNSRSTYYHSREQLIETFERYLPPDSKDWAQRAIKEALTSYRGRLDSRTVEMMQLTRVHDYNPETQKFDIHLKTEHEWKRGYKAADYEVTLTDHRRTFIFTR